MREHTKGTGRASSRAVRWSIIGLGSHAERMAQAILASRNGVLWGVASRDPARAAAFAERFQVPNVFSSEKELVERSPGGAVLISSPTHLHAAQSLLAIRSGHHVLCEKPMVLRPKDAHAIADAVRRARTVFGVGFHLRHHPLVRLARTMLAEGKIGELRFAELSWSIGRAGETALPRLTDPRKTWREDLAKSGGGAFMARGTHLVDALRFMTGMEAESVFCEMDRNPARGKVEQTALGIVRMRSGVLATIGTSRVLPNAQNRMTLYGSAARLDLHDPFDPQGGGTLEWTRGRKTVRKKGPREDVYRAEVESFASRILGKPSDGATEKDGRACVAVTEAIRRSAARRERVDV